MSIDVELGHRKRRVLLLEQDAQARAKLVDDFEQLDCEVRCVEELSQAMSMLPVFAPEVLVIDLANGRFDDIARRLRGRAKMFGLVPIIVQRPADPASMFREHTN